VFTHHTMYERYTHYLPGDSEFLRSFVSDLATGYANRCDVVFAPSESVARILVERGVEKPIRVIPTGIDIDHFQSGDRALGRSRHGLPADAKVIGHVGRLAHEKNLAFLATAVATALESEPDACFLVVGEGPSRKVIEEVFAARGLTGSLRLAGRRSGQELVDAYAAMDVFAFASLTETQGMVLTEAMAAGAPVVAIDAPGAREVVKDEENGRLLPEDASEDAFAEALLWTLREEAARRGALSEAARRTAAKFAMGRVADRALAEYERLLAEERSFGQEGIWDSALRVLEAEWELWATFAHAAGTALEDVSLRGEGASDSHDR